MSLDNMLCSHLRPLVTRRSALKGLSLGFGWLALQDLATRGLASPEAASHFPSSAKRIIFLCMRGGPSHVDTFDYKPDLVRDSGQPGKRRGSELLASPWKFSHHGESGLSISDLFPSVAQHADQLCVIKSMQTEVPAHPQAFLQLHTGSPRLVRPSLGAWTLYGLGSENENLPGFVTITPPSTFGGAQNYGSSFLPAQFQGTRIGVDRRPIRNASLPNLSRSQSSKRQREELDLLQELNRAQMHRQSQAVNGADSADPEIEGLIESFELGFRMQSELPDVMDIARETAATREMYGIGSSDTDDFGRKCLLARRLAESGVRFIEITHGNWDQHFNLKSGLEANCRATDQPIAALLQDLDQRGLLNDTLVIWSGEFGRTPHAQGGNGRDHNSTAFCSWMAGGGVRGGMTYGQSDDYGYEVAENPVSIHDWHATILRLLGFNHEHLTFNYAGRDFRLTDVYGRVINEIIA